MKNFIRILIVFLFCIILTGCSPDTKGNQANINDASNSAFKSDIIPKPSTNLALNERRFLKQPQMANTEQKVVVNTTPQNSLNGISGKMMSGGGLPGIIDKDKKKVGKEEKVVVNMNNIGRINPFRPFMTNNLVVSQNPYLPELKNIPPPPMYNSIPNPQVENLLKTKVSGILYDPGGSSAIITINENDYLVHKGDKIFSYYIKDITPDKVIIKYGQNIFKANIGESIEKTNIDPVVGIDRGFGGSRKISNGPEVKLVVPSYTSN